MNNVTQMGRLTADPELRQTTSGKSLVNFTIAVNRPYNKNETDFIRCQAWGQTAENINKFFSKGRRILIDGEMRNNDYEKDGIKHRSYIVLVNNFYFCDSKGDNAGTPSNTAASASSASSVPPTAEAAAPVLSGDIGEFEEILSDSEVPF